MTDTLVAESIGKETDGVTKENMVSDIARCAQAVFAAKAKAAPEPLQNLLDSLTAKVVGVAFEIFREQFDDLVRLLRSAYGQIARFVVGDFREDASFYLGQLHALTEIAYRLGHQRVPREALKFAAGSEAAMAILRKVAEEKSLGAGDLAKGLGMEESNLSAICKLLVQKELLRRDKFGRRVRYSSTPLTHAVLAELSGTGARATHSLESAPGKAQAAFSLQFSVDQPQMTVTAEAGPGVSVESNIQARVDFQKIQDDKKRLLDYERIVVRKVLERCDGKRSRAASILKITPKQLATLIPE